MSCHMIYWILCHVVQFRCNHIISCHACDQEPRPRARIPPSGPDLASGPDSGRTLCYAIVLPCRTSAFLAGFWPDSMLCNSASGPDIGLPGRILAGLYVMQQCFRAGNRRSGAHRSSCHILPGWVPAQKGDTSKLKPRPHWLGPGSQMWAYRNSSHILIAWAPACKVGY